MRGILPLNLYTVVVHVDGVVHGRFFAAAVDRSQAVFIGEAWASEYKLRAPRIEVRKRNSAETVYAVTA